MHGKSAFDVSPVELKFGKLNVESPDMSSILCAFILGIVCGLLGAFFVVANSKI